VLKCHADYLGRDPRKQVFRPQTRIWPFPCINCEGSMAVPIGTNFDQESISR
jgi:hypothetical protein